MSERGVGRVREVYQGKETFGRFSAKRRSAPGRGGGGVNWGVGIVFKLLRAHFFEKF